METFTFFVCCQLARIVKNDTPHNDRYVLREFEHFIVELPHDVRSQVEFGELVQAVERQHLNKRAEYLEVSAVISFQLLGVK